MSADRTNPYINPYLISRQEGGVVSPGRPKWPWEGLGQGLEAWKGIGKELGKAAGEPKTLPERPTPFVPHPEGSYLLPGLNPEPVKKVARALTEQPGTELIQPMMLAGPKYATKLQQAIKEGHPSSYEYGQALKAQDKIDKRTPFKWNPEKSWIETNKSYHGSMDPDLLCQKSEGTDVALNRLKKKLGDQYTPDHAWELLARSNEAGLQTACPQCFVWSARTKSGTAMQKRYVTGTGGYSGEALRWSPETVEHHQKLGARGYSSTDFKAEHIPGIIAQTADMASQKIPGGWYTKTEDAAHIFGPANYHINLSVGMNDKVGMNWNKAIELRNKYKNTGTAYVAMNDEQILNALRNPNVDHVLPEHLSGQSKGELSRQLGDIKVQDYTKVQNETINGKKAPDHLAIQDYEHGGDLNKYLQLVEERGLTKKFPQIYDMLGPEEKGLYMKLIGPEYGKFGGKFPYEPVTTDINYSAIDPAIRNRMKTRLGSAKEYTDIADKIAREVKSGAFKRK